MTDALEVDTWPHRSHVAVGPARSRHNGEEGHRSQLREAGRRTSLNDGGEEERRSLDGRSSLLESLLVLFLAIDILDLAPVVMVVMVVELGLIRSNKGSPQSRVS